MVIITDKETKIIINYGMTLDYLENGYPRLVNEKVAFVPYMVDIHNVEEIPQEVEPSKYCYTPEDGFYPNPDWHEPSAYDLAPQNVVDAIIDEYTNELIESGML